MMGKRLGRVRKERGYTQQNMAEYLSITLRSYQKYESNTAYPTLDKLVKIADLLDVSTDYLLCRDEFMKKRNWHENVRNQEQEPNREQESNQKQE